MLDLIFVFTPLVAIFTLLWCRFNYVKSLTGLSTDGSVGASYWGSYATAPPAAPSTEKKVALPNAIGLCPRCGNKSNARFQCFEH